MRRNRQDARSLPWRSSGVLAVSSHSTTVGALTEQQRLAQSDVPVVIEGETGTGKEVLAEALHERSDLAARATFTARCAHSGYSVGLVTPTPTRLAAAKPSASWTSRRLKRTLRSIEFRADGNNLPMCPAQMDEARGFGRMIGESPVMRRLYPLCERLAQSDVPVVIEGETGTGKEVLAEALHESGARASGPFVVFDCTAVAPSLLESALFGHEKGAFTGALAQRLGVFEQAHGGTLFIDEIGELDAVLQPKLLRAIERGEVQRVGSNRWERVEVRIIAATRRDLDREVQAGRFRDDLFFRLAVGRIDLPPLRSRRGDVAVLTRHFWRQIAGPERLVPPGLIERLEDHAWPGNVRELQNAIARHVAVGDLPDAQTLRPSGASSDPIERVLSMDLPLPRARAELVEEFERRYVESVLDRHDGNVSRAASASGIALRYFQILKARRIKRD